jgi:hypothetical protein
MEYMVLSPRALAPFLHGADMNRDSDPRMGCRSLSNGDRGHPRSCIAQRLPNLSSPGTTMPTDLLQVPVET